MDMDMDYNNSISIGHSMAARQL